MSLPATAPATPVPAAATIAPRPAPLDAFLSQKLRFWSLVSMLLLVYVHAYNLHPRYLQPWTPVQEPLTGSTWAQYLLANGLLRFRMPMLFAISGYLFAHHEGAGSHGRRVLRRVRTLLVPYAAWSAFGLAFTWALEQFGPTRQLVLATALSPFGADHLLVSTFSAKQLLWAWLLAPLLFQLWFVRSLFVCALLYPGLRAAVDRAPLPYFGLAGLLWLTGWQLPVLDGSALLFFAGGMWLRRRNISLRRAPGWFRGRPAALLWLALILSKTWLALAGPPPPLGLLTGLHRAAEVLGVLVMWFGSDAVVRAAMRRRWFEWLTGFSFIIYALHVPLLFYATTAALRRWPEWHLLVFGLLPLGVVGLIVGVAALLRRAAPAVYGLLTGGRGLVAAPSRASGPTPAPAAAPPAPVSFAKPALFVWKTCSVRARRYWAAR